MKIFQKVATHYFERSSFTPDWIGVIKALLLYTCFPCVLYREINPVLVMDADIWTFK